jgi:hypothetical protein
VKFGIATDTVRQWNGSWMQSVMMKFGSIRQVLDTMLILVARIICAISSHVKGAVMNARLALSQIATVIVFRRFISKMESVIWDNVSIKVFQLISVARCLIVIWATAKVHVSMIWDTRDLTM